MRAGRLGQLEPAVAVPVTVLAGLSLIDFYSGWLWLAVVGGAVLIGGLVAALFRSWWLGLPVGAVGLGLWVVAMCYPELSFYGAPTPEALRALGGGLLTGLPKMLSVGLPADAAGDVLVPPTVIGGLAGATVVLLCRATTSVTAPAAPPLLLYFGGLVVTASRPQPRLLVAAGVVLAVLLLLLLRSNRLGSANHEGIEVADADAVGVDLASRRWHSTMGRVVFGLPAIAGATALALVAVWFLPIADGSHRANPRTLRETSFRLEQGLTPLAQLRPQLAAPPTQLFQMTVTNPDGEFRPDRVRIAALDRFDGALWTGTRDFELTGSTLAAAEPLTPPVHHVGLEVLVESPNQTFLPVAGDPLRFRGDGFAFDRATGTLVRTTQATGPFRYQVEGQVRPQDAATRQAVPSEDPVDAERRVLPSSPPWVAELADRVAGDRVTPMSQLLAIEDYLRKQAYSGQALPGHSYGAIKRVLLGVPADRVGSAEQYAAAFAILARAKGYATRVAVGYQLRPEQRAGDTFTVFSTDLHAWPEVHLKDQGWVAFEPTDARTPVAPQPPRGPEVTLAAADQDIPVIEPRRAGLDSMTARDIGIGAAVVLCGVLALLLLGGLVVVLGKSVRRRRRARRGSPARRIVGAWAEVVDRLQEAGLPAPGSAAMSEVAVDAHRSPSVVSASVALDAMAPLVTEAIYGPYEPSEVAAARAWELQRTIHRQVVRSLGLFRRIRGAVDPRTLWPRLRRQPRSLAEPTPLVPVVAAGLERGQP